MSTAKQQVRQILDHLGDDATLDQIQYAIYVRQKAERGLEDLAAGRSLPHDDVRARMARWLEPSGGPK